MSPERRVIAGYFGIDLVTYCPFTFCCVVAADSAEDLFHALLKDHNIKNVSVHNLYKKGETLEFAAQDLAHSLGNRELTIFTPDNRVIMSYNAYLQLGCIFFDADSICILEAYSNIVKDARTSVDEVLEYYSEFGKKYEREMIAWRRLKLVEDEKLLKANLLLGTR